MLPFDNKLLKFFFALFYSEIQCLRRIKIEIKSLQTNIFTFTDLGRFITRMANIVLLLIHFGVCCTHLVQFKKF